MSIFEERKSISRENLRKELGKSDSKVPSKSDWTTSEKRISRKERVGLEKDVFGKKYGDYISKSEFKSAIRDLEVSKMKTSNRQEKNDIDTRIRYLRKIGDV
jgi:hypothetical protein